MSLQLPGRTILRLSYPDADTRPWRLLPGFSSQDSLTAKEYSHGWVLELQRGNNSTHILHDAKAGCRRPAWLGAFEMHSRTRGRSRWRYLQWLLWAPSGGQNPGIPSEPRGSGQHPQSWGGCWSGQLAESHCRRWYNSHWLYADCSPKSTTRKGSHFARINSVHLAKIMLIFLTSFL